MAGYMTILNSNVYDGQFINGAAAPVADGTLMVVADDGKALKLPEADTASKFIAREVTTIYDGIPAVRFVVASLAKPMYLVETQSVYNDDEVYDTTARTTAVGALLRAHPISIGEEFLQSTTETFTENNTYGVKATGLVG